MPTDAELGARLALVVVTLLIGLPVVSAIVEGLQGRWWR